MILTCPACAARYFVEDQRLGAAGRTVRCAGCGEAWKAEAEEPLELTIDGEQGAHARRSFAGSEPERPTLSEVAAPALPRTYRARVEQQRKVRDAAAAGIVWAGMTCAFALLFGVAYLFRMDVVKLYPRAAGAYAMAGVRVNPTGLEFQNIKAQAAPDGLAAVVVTGQVRNVVDHAAEPPPLKVSLIDKSGRRTASQLLRLAPARVRPGQMVPFSVSLPDPGAAAADVDVAFAMDVTAIRSPGVLTNRPAPPAKLAMAKAAVSAKAKTSLVASVGKPPARAMSLVLRPIMLRPAVGLPETARPLPPGDPYALDSGAPKAVSAGRHG